MTLPRELVYRPEFSHLQDPTRGDPAIGTPQGGQEQGTEGGGPPGAAPTADPCSGMLLPMVLVFAVIYFLMIRPQQKQEKQRRAMLSEVQKGDKVVTTGGVHGTITILNDDTVTLRVDTIKMTVDRAAIARVLTDDKGAPPQG